MIRLLHIPRRGLLSDDPDNIAGLAEALQTADTSLVVVIDVYDKLRGTLTRFTTAQTRTITGLTETSYPLDINTPDAILNAENSQRTDDALLNLTDFALVDPLVLNEWLSNTVKDCPTPVALTAMLIGSGEFIPVAYNWSGVLLRLDAALQYANGLFDGKVFTLAEANNIRPHVLNMVMYMLRPSGVKTKDTLGAELYQRAVNVLRPWLVAQDNSGYTTPATSTSNPVYNVEERVAFGVSRES